MKVFNRVILVVFNISLLLSSIIIPALNLMSSHNFYYREFEKNDIYATINANGEKVNRVIPYVGGEKNKCATFSDEQINCIVNHIIDYLFTEQNDFQLIMDDVVVNGVKTDNVEIFGSKAIKHMKDVKNLVNIAKIVAICLIVLMVGIGAYLICNIKKIYKDIFNVSKKFYIAVAVFIITYCLWSLIEVLLDKDNMSIELYAYILWRNVHYLLFPFQPQKFADSSFSDVLTEILPLNMFITAVGIVLVFTLIVVISWLVVAFIIKNKVKVKSKSKAINP